ncbi:hypothetical protein RYX36_001845 [Vicia faba]
MANVDSVLFSIVHSSKATSLTPSSIIFKTTPHIQTNFETLPYTPTNTTTNNITPHQNPTPSSFRTLPNTLSQQPKRKNRKRNSRNNNAKRLECHVSVDKLKEDPWAWRKYGEKLIKGSSHPRSYYKCSSFNDCSARKLVEKSKTKENTYVVTYKGDHNHKEPERNHKSINRTSRKKSSKTRLSTAEVIGSSPNVRNIDSSNVVIAQSDQTENINTQIIPTKSKDLCPNVETFSNIGKLDSPNLMMMQFDEPENTVHAFTNESKITSSGTKSSGSCDDDDHDILIPNMRAMSEDILLDFNRLNGGRLFS